MRRPAALALTLVAVACNIDAFLEAPDKDEIRLSMAVTASALNVTPGGTATLEATITRLTEYAGEVGFSLTGVPEGITTGVGTPLTTGKATTATITFTASAAAAVGTQVVTIRGTVGSDIRITQQVTLVVTAIPAVGVLPATQSLVVIRGGIAPVGVLLNRTNFTAPVTVSLQGPTGITATIAGGAVAGSAASMTIAVAPTVAPGTYQAALRAAAPGIVDATAPLTIIVSPDALQLIVDHAATVQATVVTTPVLVNRFGVDGAITISGEGLPAGVTVSFPGGPALGTSSSARFIVGASTPPGAYPVTLRAQRAGVPDATTTFVLTVGASNVAMTLAPQSVTMLQGTSAASTLQIVRTSFTGAVGVQVVAAPAGIVVQPAEATITGTGTTLLVQAARALTPGSYPVGVRVVPAPSEADGPALNPVTTTLLVTVVEAPTVNANVLLDFSACAIPSWVAAQDGTGSWTRLTGVQGRFGFALTSVRGGFAWDEGGTGIRVRFMTSAELTAGPINLCVAPPPATHEVIGFAQHAAANEVFTWRLGGGVGTSTLAMPNYTITGVRDGTHDLIGWGTINNFQQRMLLQRDVNLPAGGWLGITTLTAGSNVFAPVTGPANFQGLLSDRVAITMSYLTTTACTDNILHQYAGTAAQSGTYSFTLSGVPAIQQRPTDFHEAFIAATSPSTNITRTASLSFTTMIQTPRQIPLPPHLAASVVRLSGSHLRLRAVVSVLPAEYNGTLTLRYFDGSRAASISASAATFALGSVAILDMPDFGGVAGFPVASVSPSAATGSYALSADGASGEGTRCADGATRRSWLRPGVF